jgi:hypothetical protein
VTIQLVLAPTDDDGDPTHGYTVGLCQAYGHPELLIVGLPAVHTEDVLAHAVENVARGRRYAPGEQATDLFPSATAVMRRVGEAHFGEYLAHAVHHYGATDFAVLQIVFPDRAGRYPWDTGADLRMKLVQPVLDGKFRKCRWSCS